MKKIFNVFILLFALFLLVSCEIVDEIKLPSVEVDYYLVGFETNGGSEIPNLKLKAGANLVLPKDPTKEGFEFAGWYTDSKLKNKFENPGKMPEESFWLYADWNVTLTFDSKGGTECESISARPGSILGELPTPKNGNHIFQGWFLDEAYTKKLGLVMPKENTKVYARWQGIEETTVLDITNTIKVNGTNTYYLEEVPEGYKVTALTGKGVWDYFYFTLDFNVKDYSMFEIIVEGPKDVKYMTKLESGGATATEVGRVLTGGEDKIYWTVQPANLTATGGEKFIIFLNYNVQGVTAENPEYIIIKSIKLYRTIDVNETQKHAIFFETNGGSVVAPIFGVEGSAVTLPANPTKPGYEFGGWYLDKECTKPADIKTMPVGPTVLYAAWNESKSIQINFVTNGGTAVNPITTTAGSNVGTLPTTTLDGKLFVGWYTDEFFTNKFTSLTYDDNMTLYAYFIDPNTQLCNTTSFLNGWSVNEAGTYVIENETNLKITTTSSKGTWAYIKTMINPVGELDNILKVVVTGTESKSMLIKLRGVSGKDYEYKVTFTGTEQTLYFVLPEAVKYDYQAIIFVDGGKTGSAAGVTEVLITELSLNQPGVGIDLTKYELMTFDAIIGYWNSKDSKLGSTVFTNQAYYLTNTVRFSKEQLPVGSIIVVANGWQYRPDGWTTETTNTSERKPETKETMVVCDETWWGDYVLRAFNISKVGKPKLTDSDLANINKIFKIYVPKTK